MNLGEASVKYNTIVWMFVLLLAGGGYYSYMNMGRLEDPEFTIKSARVVTLYPGATPLEVEQEVTDPLEQAIQQLAELDNVTSTSQAGLSVISVNILSTVPKQDLPAVWNKLRNKIHDAQGNLPPGCQAPIVNDDFGDVYGVYYAITGEGYSYREMKAYVDRLRTELLLVDQVAKIGILGDQQEAVYLDIDQSRMAALGISQGELSAVLQGQNLVTPSGNLHAGAEYIRIHPTGAFTSIDDIGEILLARGTNGAMIRIRDIATVQRDYRDPATTLARFSRPATGTAPPLVSAPAITLGVSTIPGGNVVRMGEALAARLAELESIRPVGMEVHTIYNQAAEVEKSVSGFVSNFVEAILIVIAVLLVTMGLRSGLIIAVVLCLTVAGALLLMFTGDISLQRISLGALILALGMLVDNAIVVTESMMVDMQAGVKPTESARRTVGQFQGPLLLATIIAFTAFSGIGLSPDSTGEYCGSLFWVMFYSLSLSWALAVIVTPLFCVHYLKRGTAGETGGDPYAARPFQIYKAMLLWCIRHRYVTILLAVLLLGMGVKGFTFVKNSFFPNSTTPMFYVHYWRPQGSDIQTTSADLKMIEGRILAMDGVEAITTVVGGGALRFTLTYGAESPNPSYGTLIVRVGDYTTIPGMTADIKAMLARDFPESEPKVERMELGPGGGAKIEARISGSDAVVLRNLGEQVASVMRADPVTTEIRTDWRQKTKVVRPVFDPVRARRAGVTRADLYHSLQMAYGGTSVGLYREEDKLLPILLRLPLRERDDPSSLSNLQIWSELTNQTVPIRQVTNGIGTAFENPILARRNRKRTMTVSCNPREGLASPVFARLRPAIEAIPLPEGYTLEWGGEFESSGDATRALIPIVLMSFLAMGILIVIQFNAVRQPLILILIVPLAIVGVTAGLLAFDLPFSFMALLGTLSLIGMLIKNGIVLISQIDEDIAGGKTPFPALVEASISRLRPVTMGALTTVMGMIPLVKDAFFVDMAVAIMFGLTFATVLTMIVVPVLYAIFFRIPYGGAASASGETAFTPTPARTAPKDTASSPTPSDSSGA